MTGRRVKVIIGADHHGELGTLVSGERADGSAVVEFDGGGELVTMDACRLQYQDGPDDDSQ